MEGRMRMRQDKCKPTTFHLQPPPAIITFNHYLGGTGHSNYTAQEGLIEDHTSRISDISVRAIVTSQSTFGNGYFAENPTLAWQEQISNSPYNRVARYNSSYKSGNMALLSPHQALWGGLNTLISFYVIF